MKSIKGEDDSTECLEFKFNSTIKNIFQNNINRKHPRVRTGLGLINPDENIKHFELENNDNSEDASKEESSDEEDDLLYQVEMVNGETVFACNLCNEGLDDLDIIEKHIEENHGKIVTYKEWTPGSTSGDSNHSIFYNVLRHVLLIDR